MNNLELTTLAVLSFCGSVYFIFLFIKSKHEKKREKLKQLFYKNLLKKD